jgi:hypothetical protein
MFFQNFYNAEQLHMMPTPKAESTSAVKLCEGFKLAILAVFSGSNCIKRKKGVPPLCCPKHLYQAAFPHGPCFDHQIRTDKLKGSKQIYVNWQHDSSDGRKTLLLAPYFTGALCGISRLIRKPSDP